MSEMMNNQSSNSEVLFESSYVRNPELVKEMLGIFYLKRPLRIAIDIFCVLYFLCGMLAIVFDGFEPLYLLYILVPALYVTMTVLNYRRMKKIQIQRDLEQNGGKYVEGTVSVTDSAVLHVTSMKASTAVELSTIKAAVKSKNHVFLLTQSRLLYTLSNDFAKGTPDGLLDFLRSKGIKCK